MSSVVLSPTTGQTLSISPAWDVVSLNPATALARLKLVLPPSDKVDAAFMVQSSKSITNLDVDINGASRISGMPTQLGSDQALTFVYTGVTQSWSVTVGGQINVDYASSTYYVLGTNPLIVQVDPSGLLRSADLAFILRQGQLVGLNLRQLRPPAATLLGGDGLGSYTSLELGDGLDIQSGQLVIRFGDQPGTVASGDVLEATQRVAFAALPLAGGTLTGPISLAGDPTLALHAATKRYVDAGLSSVRITAASALVAAQNAVQTAVAAMPILGGVFTGAITLAADPTAAMHAATKSYVDAGVLRAVSSAETALTVAQNAQTIAGASLSKTNNLGDLTSPAAARLNLGLGSAAVFSIGQGHNTVAAGDDPRLLGALQSTIFGVPNGVATLDQFGRLNVAQIPLSLLGAMVYQGAWNAAANSPLLQSGIGAKGAYYVVSVPSTTVTLDGISQWNVGDWAVFDGQRWDKLDGLSSEVVNVLGLTGSITLAQLVSAGVAPLASPAFSGSPTATTPLSTDNSLRIPTTAWVTANFLKNAGGSLIGTTIENSPIGATTPASARFTTIGLTGVQASSSVLAAPVGGGAPTFRQLSAADITGLGGLASQAASNVALTGGSIDGVAIGSTSPSAGTFTTLALTAAQAARTVLAGPASGTGAPTWRQLANTDLTGFGTLSVQSASSVAITGGSIGGTTVGLTAPASGAFTTLAASAGVSFGASSYLVVGPATGGNMGAGTINATAIYVNGQAVGIAGGYSLPSATTTTLGGVIVPATTGPSGSNLAVDGVGNLSVVWGSPGAIGLNVPAAGAFTTLTASGNVVFSGTGTLQIPVGTTGQRPGTPGQGMFRFNSTTLRSEVYNGTSWQSFVRLAGDTMTGTLALTSIACSGGTVDGTAIGSTTPSSAAFTTLSVAGAATVVGPSASLVVGAPTGGSGGNMGAGSINAAALYVNGVAVSTSTTSPATATKIGAVVVPASGGLLVDASGALSVNWASPGALGATTPASATFTTLSLTAAQGASAVLAAPAGGGAPAFRALAVADIAGLGTLATQSAGSVAITGGTLSALTAVSLGTNGQAGVALTLNSASGNTRSLFIQSAGVNRWQLATSAAGETGSNTGSDLAFNSFADGGAALYTPISISRASGLVTFARGAAITGGTLDGASIGSTTPATGRFTTLTLTGPQTSSYVLAAPSGGGSPVFRALTAADVSGLGSLAGQSAGNVSITGGTLSGVTLSSLSSINFGSSLGTKVLLWGSSYGLGISNNELGLFLDSAAAVRFRSGGSLTGSVIFTCDANGIQGTPIGSTTPSSGRFSSIITTGSGSSIVGVPTSAQIQGVGVTLMLSGSIQPGVYFVTGNSPFGWTINSVNFYGGSVNGAGFTFSVQVGGSSATFYNQAQSMSTGTTGSTSFLPAQSGNNVNAGVAVTVVVTALSGNPANGYVTLNGVRNGLN